MIFVVTEDRAVVDRRTAERSVGRLSDSVWRSDSVEPVVDAKQLLLVGGSLGISALAEVWTQVSACFNGLLLSEVLLTVVLSVASLGAGGGPPRVTPSRGWLPTRINFFCGWT